MHSVYNYCTKTYPIDFEDNSTDVTKVPVVNTYGDLLRSDAKYKFLNGVGMMVKPDNCNTHILLIAANTVPEYITKLHHIATKFYSDVRDHHTANHHPHQPFIYFSSGDILYKHLCQHYDNHLKPLGFPRHFFCNKDVLAFMESYGTAVNLFGKSLVWDNFYPEPENHPDAEYIYYVVLNGLLKTLKKEVDQISSFYCERTPLISFASLGSSIDVDTRFKIRNCFNKFCYTVSIPDNEKMIKAEQNIIYHLYNLYYSQRALTAPNLKTITNVNNKFLAKCFIHSLVEGHPNSYIATCMNIFPMLNKTTLHGKDYKTCTKSAYYTETQKSGSVYIARSKRDGDVQPFGIEKAIKQLFVILYKKDLNNKTSLDSINRIFDYEYINKTINQYRGEYPDNKNLQTYTEEGIYGLIIKGDYQYRNEINLDTNKLIYNITKQIDHFKLRYNYLDLAMFLIVGVCISGGSLGMKKSIIKRFFREFVKHLDTDSNPSYKEDLIKINKAIDGTTRHFNDLYRIYSLNTEGFENDKTLYEYITQCLASEVSSHFRDWFMIDFGKDTLHDTIFTHKVDMLLSMDIISVIAKNYRVVNKNKEFVGSGPLSHLTDTWMSTVKFLRSSYN